MIWGDKRHSLYKFLFISFLELKSLTLKGLEHMPKISDTLFRLIIRLLKLKQLTLEGGHKMPLKNVSSLLM